MENYFKGQFLVDFIGRGVIFVKAATDSSNDSIFEEIIKLLQLIFFLDTIFLGNLFDSV
jgi:hypothetical protein